MGLDLEFVTEVVVWVRVERNQTGLGGERCGCSLSSLPDIGKEIDTSPTKTFT